MADAAPASPQRRAGIAAFGMIIRRGGEKITRIIVTRRHRPW
jgi:hypothetical protein